jgi:hypothetical protein
MINFTLLPDWMDDNIWMDKIMLSGLEGTYAMIVDKEGYITDTRLLTDYEGNNLPEGTLWLPTSRFRSQFRELWGDFSMDSYMNNHDESFGDDQTTRRELANIIKLANRFIIGEEDVWIKNNQADDDRTFDHPYLYHYSLSRRQVRELTDSITVSIYHIHDLKDNKFKIIFNVTDLWISLKRPEWNPRAQTPFSVLFG